MNGRALLLDGLRDRNPGLVQLLGLCPLLAVSNSVASAFGLGVATLAVLLASNLFAALAGPLLPREVRLAVFVVVIAAAVTTVELSMAAWWPGLHASLGIFLPLIVTNCLVLARAEAFASRASPSRALADGLGMGLGFLAALLLLGATRELLGHRLLIARLPPGAFVLLGLLLALGNAWGFWRRRGAPAPSPSPVAEPGA
jgi:electron transport complex protein RnfE